MSDETLIRRRLFEAKKGNDKAEIESSYCSLEDCHNQCPFLKRGKCIQLGFLSSCIYGQTRSKIGPTRRAKKYYIFVQDAKKDIENLKKELKSVVATYCKEEYFAKMGEYVFLPYSHMTMCKEVPFIRHSCFFVSGVPYVKAEDFDVHTVVTLAKFRAMAMMGGEIKCYQKAEVPLFLIHLKHMMPDMYKAAVILDDSIVEKTPSVEDIKSLEGTLDAIHIGMTDRFTVFGKKVLSWDGKILKVECEKPLLKDYYGVNFTLEYEPDVERTKICIQDKNLVRSIVTEHPEFITKQALGLEK